MTILNTAVCALNGGNTGISNCSVDFNTLNKGFLVPTDFVLTEAQLVSPATVMAALIAAASANIASQRIYPLPETLTVTDNSEAAVQQTYGYGAVVTVRDGMANIAVNWKKGGLCLRNQLAKFNGNSWAWLAIDAEGRLIGTKVGKTMKGIPLNEFYQDPFKWADGANQTAYIYKLSYNTRYINSDVAFVPLNYGEVSAISGLINIVPELVTYPGANIFTVRLLAGCAKDNLYDLYSTALANVANFSVVNATTGNAITITSVTVDANSKGFIFTLNSSDPDYVAGGPFVVSGSTVSALATNLVVGFEILPLTIVTP